MSAFDDAFTALIGNEGGYSNNPADPGGETMWGITARVARGWGYQGAMKDLPLETAKAIARKFYWDPYQCDQFDPRVSFQIFDAAYNGGHPAQWLQQAAGVAADGSIREITVAAVRAADPLKIVILFNASRILYYTSLGTWESFGKGWSNRIANNLRRAAS
jgi:lysozyme family protein